MSWPNWAATGAQPPLPGINTTPVVNPAPAVMPPGMQYTPDQWAQLQQQNWNQWAQWQQQYQQWHQQYGAEYQKSLNALSAQVTQQPPVPALPNMAVPPPLPTEPKPPLPIGDPPPNYNATTNYNSTATNAFPPAPNYTTAPPPTKPNPPLPDTAGIGAQRMDTGTTVRNDTGPGRHDTGPGRNDTGPGRNDTGPVRNDPGSLRNNTQNWMNQSHNNKRQFDQQHNYDRDPKRQMMTKPTWSTTKPPPPQQQQAPPQQQPQPVNNNPEELSEAEKKFDKQFAEWEAQFNKWKEQNAEHPDKEQYREYEKKWETWRAQLLERREQMKRKRLGLLPNQQTTKYPPPNSQFSKPPPLITNAPPPTVSKPPVVDPPTESTSSFLKMSSEGGIPGLDLVTNDPKPPLTESDDVILVDPNAKPPLKSQQKEGPDFDAISKGINTILGDQKLLNMLSLVTQNQNVQSGDNLVNTTPKIRENSNQDSSYQPPFNEQSSQSHEDYSNHSNDNYVQREFVNNFDDQTRSSFTMGPNEFDGGAGGQQRNSLRFEPPPPRNFDRGNFSKVDFQAPLNRGGGGGGGGGDFDRFRGGDNQRKDFDRFGNNQNRFGGPDMGDRPPFGGPRGGGDDRFGFQDSRQFPRDDFVAPKGKGGGNFDRPPIRGGNDDRFGFKDNRPFPRDQFEPPIISRGGDGGEFDRGPRGGFNPPATDGRQFPPRDDFRGRGGDGQDFDGRSGPNFDNRFGPRNDNRAFSDINQLGKGQNFEERNFRGPPRDSFNEDRNFDQEDYDQDDYIDNERSRFELSNQEAEVSCNEDLIDKKLVVEPPEDILKPATVIDYDHKSLKPADPEILLEPIRMFDYRHKSLSRIPLPQRPAWLYDTVRNIREFDPPVVRPYELSNFRRYPPPIDNWRNERSFQDDWAPSHGPNNRRHGNDSHRSQYEERERRSFNDNYKEPQSSERYNPEESRRNLDSSTEKSFKDRDNDDFSDFEEPESRPIKKMEENRKNIEKQSSPFSPRFPIKTDTNKPVTKTAVLIEDLINPPGRHSRAPRIVIILRGPPGSGKTFLAKLIKDKEVENGGSPPRILSLDDYFMVEQEKEIIEDGKKVKVKEMVYEYEAEVEESYRLSLVKSFKKTITDGYFPFIIVDNVNDKVKYFGEMWSFAKQNGFQVYICQLDIDVQSCSKRNIHGRSEADIEKCVNGWEPTPNHHPVVDATSLLQSGSIREVEMEEVNSPESDDFDKDAEEDDQVTRSKWDNFDCSIDNLAKLDGLSKPLRTSRTMEEYLQLDTDWTPKSAKPGQKRVRWADLEEQKQQEKMRAIGFVVGQTDWGRMMDPTMGGSALTQTKYIERTGRF